MLKELPINPISIKRVSINRAVLSTASFKGRPNKNFFLFLLILQDKPLMHI